MCFVVDTDQFIPRNFIAGYTGYIPQLKNHFGKSITKTLVDGDIGNSSGHPLRRVVAHQNFLQSDIKPIPGFTGKGKLISIFDLN